MALIFISPDCNYRGDAMSITNKLNQIKNAIYGKDVRGAIHDAIKECYDVASVNHDNANMEVKMARGTHNTLNDRLDKSDEIQAQTNAQLSEKERKNKLYIKDYATSGDITDVIDDVLYECKNKGYNLDLSGDWILTKTVDVDFPVLIRNGKIKVPSFASDGTTEHVIFNITSSNVIFSNVYVESDNDQIPRLNIRNNLNTGLASNVVFVKGDNITNLVCRDCSFNKITVGSFSDCKSVYFDNCKSNLTESGLYCYRCVDVKFINSFIECSTQVGSGYYHAFYMIENTDVLLGELNIKSSDDADALSDIFHFYNPSNTASNKGYRSVVSNVNVEGNFARLAQLNLHEDVRFDNIVGTFNTHIIQLNRGARNILVNNSHFTIKNKLATTAIVYSTQFEAENSCRIYNTTFNVVDYVSGGFLDTCNVSYHHCVFRTTKELPVAKSLNSGYLTCHNCTFSTPSNISNMFNGTLGEYNYYSCVFNCVNTALYVSYNFNVNVKMKIINCFFTINRKLFDTSVVNPNTVVINSSGYYNGTGVHYEYLGQPQSNLGTIGQ